MSNQELIHRLGIAMEALNTLVNEEEIKTIEQARDYVKIVLRILTPEKK